MAFVRYDSDRLNGRRLLIVLNMGATDQTLNLAGIGDHFFSRGRMLLASVLRREGEFVSDHVALAGHEGIIVEPG